MRPKKLIQFYMTNQCNSHCRTCEIWKTKPEDKLELDLDKVLEIVRDYRNADFVFGGGEFTLYSKRHELLTYCDDNDISYTVLSNCVDFDRLVNLVLSHNIKNLTISCDGVYHDTIRGVKGNLDNIKRFIENYSHKIPNMKISYTLSRFNQNNINDDMDLFKSLGFEKIYFCLAQDMDLLKVGGKELVTPDWEYVDYFYDHYSSMLYDKDKQFLDDYLDDTRKMCDSVSDVHTIYTNGDVVVCQSKLSDVVLLNIYETSFNEIDEVTKYTGICPYNDKCALVCQRRYDYEDRL